MPVRIQRKRTKGWRTPPNTVYVGRPTKYGNPAKVEYFEGDDKQQQAVDWYRKWITSSPLGVLANVIKRELRGKDLACFCPIDQPCHADVLLEIANED